jgi:hypothetical protein
MKRTSGKLFYPKDILKNNPTDKRGNHKIKFKKIFKLDMNFDAIYFERYYDRKKQQKLKMFQNLKNLVSLNE